MVGKNTYKHGFPFDKYHLCPTVKAQRDPTASDLKDPNAGGYYNTPTIWVNENTDTAWLFTGVISGTSANWKVIAPVAGSFTLAAGTTTQIPYASITANSVVAYTVKTLGTVTAASSFLTTIVPGVGFTPVASQSTDTSVVNWAIVA